MFSALKQLFDVLEELLQQYYVSGLFKNDQNNMKKNPRIAHRVLLCIISILIKVSFTVYNPISVESTKRKLKLKMRF